MPIESVREVVAGPPSRRWRPRRRSCSVFSTCGARSFRCSTRRRCSARRRAPVNFAAVLQTPDGLAGLAATGFPQRAVLDDRDRPIGAAGHHRGLSTGPTGRRAARPGRAADVAGAVGGRDRDVALPVGRRLMAALSVEADPGIASPRKPRDASPNSISCCSSSRERRRTRPDPFGLPGGPHAQGVLRGRRSRRGQPARPRAGGAGRGPAQRATTRSRPDVIDRLLAGGGPAGRSHRAQPQAAGDARRRSRSIVVAEPSSAPSRAHERRGRARRAAQSGRARSRDQHGTARRRPATRRSARHAPRDRSCCRRRR